MWNCVSRSCRCVLLYLLKHTDVELKSRYQCLWPSSRLCIQKGLTFTVSESALLAGLGAGVRVLSTLIYRCGWYMDYMDVDPQHFQPLLSMSKGFFLILGYHYLWSPYVIGQTIIFSSCGFFFFLFFLA